MLQGRTDGRAELLRCKNKVISSRVIFEAKTGEAQDSQDSGGTAGEAGTGVGASLEKFRRTEETASVGERSWAKTELGLLRMDSWKDCPISRPEKKVALARHI